MAASATACSGGGETSDAASAPDAASAADDTASTADEGDAGDAGDAAPVSGTITFLSWNNETAMDPVLQGFRDANPDVTIDLIYAPPVQDYVEKFQILYSTGELTYADGWTKPMELWKENYLDAGMINEDALGLTGDQANEIFAFEEAAYMVGATWSPAALEELNPDLEYGMLPWFGSEDGVAWMTGAAGVGWSINKDAKNMDGAKALLEYLTTDEALKVSQEETAGILAVDGIDFPLDPVLEEGYQYFLDGKYYLPATAWKYSDALGNNMTINSQEIVVGNMTIEQFVQDMDDTREELDAEQ